MAHFTSYGGGVDQTAVIGHPPEHRAWKPGDELYEPEIDATVRIEAFVTVDAGYKRPTKIGARCYLLKHAHVGHDAVLEEDVEIATGAIVGGHALIEKGARIGLNAVILPGRTIGAGARVGAGAVVTKDVKPGEVVAGNPARPLQRGVPFSKDGITDDGIDILTGA